MNIQAIVLDIDGTLLNSKKRITEKTKNALVTAQKNGIKLILASGRPTTAMQKYAELLSMDKYKGLLVSYNGAKVVDCHTNNVLFDQSLTVEEGKAVLEHMKHFDVKVMVDKEDYMYVNDVFDHDIVYKGETINIIEYESRGGNYKLCEKEDLADFLDYRVNKILTAGDPQYLIENYQKMSQPFIDRLNCVFTADFYYEFTAKGIDKAKALDSVLASMKLSSEKIVAFGDGHNDISMIEYAGTGIAMENAVEDLKEKADKITLSNDQDGIAYALETFF